VGFGASYSAPAIGKVSHIDPVFPDRLKDIYILVDLMISVGLCIFINKIVRHDLRFISISIISFIVWCPDPIV